MLGALVFLGLLRYHKGEVHTVRRQIDGQAPVRRRHLTVFLHYFSLSNMLEL